MPDFDFSEPRHTQQLWERQILPCWAHRDHPTGQRFLGSVRLEQQITDQILDIVGRNLSQLGRVTYHSIYEHFYEPKQNWLKILTFALSEYAYHYSSPAEKFWQGFCQRLKLPYGQGIENTLRRIVDGGIDLLGLVRTQGGYRYVSTLWLQSGIPKQNLTHFAQLVQEVSDEYGWWELAHTEHEDLSQELLDFCQNKHPQWGTLIHFLKSSCCLDGEDQVEPISGQLVQGIATVAQELERKNLSAKTLQDDNQREEFLGRYYLPQNFFLRNWDSLIRVLTPKGRSSSRTIVSRRKKPLSLILDVADSLNIQLFLPEQSLGCAEWKNLSETFCQITESGWEGTIPGSGVLSIPEQVVNVSSVCDRFHWQLLDHKRSCLVEWHFEGVVSDFPCLMFDAWSGERILLHLPNPCVRGTEEIICFTPREIQITFANGIEILDSCVPSSIYGWQGQQIRLTTKESSIVFTAANTTTPQIISWKLSDNEQPQITGLKLKGKKSTYLEIPTFWHPPTDQAVSLNISIESLTHQSTLINTTENLTSSNRWVSISLARWINKPGTYEARFWNSTHRWSYRFEIQSDYQLSGKPNISNLNLNSLQGQITSLPIQYNASEKFWSEVVNFEGFWPLEVVTFSLLNTHDKVFYLGQADSSGHLGLSLAVLHDCLPDSNWYALDYQQLGLEPQRLIEMETAAPSISWTWANQVIHLSGLQPDQLYELSCWNLLLPQSKPVKLKIPLVSPQENSIIVPLQLPFGIYHIQLVSSRRLPQNLGWWCSSSKYQLPEQAEMGSSLENYCLTILGNEDVNDFLEAATNLNFDYDYQWIQTVISSLQAHPYHFPEWLNSDSLLAKLQALLEPPLVPSPPPEWYRVTLLCQKPIRGLFVKLMEERTQIPIKQGGLKNFVLNFNVSTSLKITTPQQQGYQIFALFEFKKLQRHDLDLLMQLNLQTVSNCIKQAGYICEIKSTKITEEKSKNIWQISNTYKFLEIRKNVA